MQNNQPTNPYLYTDTEHDLLLYINYNIVILIKSMINLSNN